MLFDLSRRTFLGFVAALIVGASPAFRAQSEPTSTNYLLTVSTERPDAIYRKGEDVSFQIKPGVPAMCDHTGAAVGRISGWPKLVPNGADGKPDAKVLEAARYYDATNFATRTKAAGIVTVGFIDTTCPPTSVYAAYNALKSRKEIFNDPPSTHTVSANAGRAMRDAILRQVEATKTVK